MRSFLLNKLIRDKVLTSMQELGQDIVHRKLDDEEFLNELKRKLLEEASEFDPSQPKAIDELADLMEVIETLCSELGTNLEELGKVQLKRREQKGAFKNRVFVERLNLQDDDEWANYYANEPDRFTEIKD